MQVSISNVLALDYGERRIGVAVANLLARLPHPLTTLDNSPEFWDELRRLINKEDISLVVVGLPRGMQGQETAQTSRVRDFVSALSEKISLPVHIQDEAVTSRNAEAELRSTKGRFSKSQVDALAATYILGDFLSTYKGDIDE